MRNLQLYQITWLLPAFMAVFAFLQCESTQKKEVVAPGPVLSYEQYQQLHWQQKANSFTQRKAAPAHADDFKIFDSALEDDHEVICAAALEQIAEHKITRYHDKVSELLKSDSALVRYKALLALEALPLRPNDAAAIAGRFNDKEWLVREAAYRSVRRYTSELEEKKYFFQLLVELDEQNPTVLRELYRTLRWYNDDRAFPYIYRRSFLTTSEVELIFILRELARYNQPLARKRLVEAARTHPKIVVRYEAQQLLKEIQ